MKLKDIFNSVNLREDEVDDKFGQLAFGDSPTLIKMQGGSASEPNTKFENELKLTLSAWLKSASDKSSDEIYQHREILKRAAQKFPEILKPNTKNGTSLYRGLQKPDSSLLEALSNYGKEVWNFYAKINGVTWYKPDKSITIKYNPQKNIQSWTDDFVVAVDFASQIKNESVILVTEQTDDFLFNQDFLFELAPKDFGYESEVIHIGKEYERPVEIVINKYMYETIKEI